MEEQETILTYSITCDYCQKTIKAGEAIFPIYQEFDWDNIPLEEVRSIWILSFCATCMSNISSK